MSAPTLMAPAADAAPPARESRGRIGGVTRAFWLFVGPFLVGLVIFVYVPIVWSVVLSFSRAQNTVTPGDWVGLQNYIDLLQPGPFLDSLHHVHDLRGVHRAADVCAFPRLGAAAQRRQGRCAHSSARCTSCPPPAPTSWPHWSGSCRSSTAYGSGWQTPCSSWFGVENIAWLATTNPPWYWLVIVTVRLWLQIGFYMILFLAGLQRISPELYEAAAVDGARNAWQTFRYITFPQLRATSVAVLLLLLINAYQAFDEFFNLLGNSSFARPPLVYLYYTAQGNQDFGHGTAGAVILALLIMVVTLAQGRILGFGKAE